MGAIVSRDKLAAILGLMGSDHDGEALAAARMAEKLRREMDLTWQQLLGEGGTSSDRPSGQADWRQAAAFCGRHHWLLTEWELRFVYQISRYPARPSPKQMAILEGLVVRCRSG